MSALRHRRAALPAAVLLVATIGVACGGGDAEACGPVQREPLDPRFLQHTVGGDADVEYATDPPTSGPHTPSPPITGVQDRAIPRPIQVGILEAGKVLVQHRGLSPADLRSLEAQVGDRVVVAPAADLPGDSTVVATAWLHKQECTAVDADALEAFVADHVGKGPGADG